MKRLLSSLFLVLLAASESHALRSGSTKSLSVQNGSATVQCIQDGGTTPALLYDIDGTTSTNSASCITLPTDCGSTKFLRWNGTSLVCLDPPASGSSLTSFIVTQSQTPIEFITGVPDRFMGLGGTIRDTSSSFVRLSPSAAVTVNNMYCNTHGVPTGSATATVSLMYVTAGNFGAVSGASVTVSNTLTVTLSNTNNVALSVATGAVTIPAGAYVGYKVSTTSGFPSIEQGVDISCTLERTA